MPNCQGHTIVCESSNTLEVVSFSHECLFRKKFAFGYSERNIFGFLPMHSRIFICCFLSPHFYSFFNGLCTVSYGIECVGMEKVVLKVQCPLDIATLDIAAALAIATSTPVTNLRQYINSDLGYNDLGYNNLKF